MKTCLQPDILHLSEEKRKEALHNFPGKSVCPVLIADQRIRIKKNIWLKLIRVLIENYRLQVVSGSNTRRLEQVQEENSRGNFDSDIIPQVFDLLKIDGDLHRGLNGGSSGDRQRGYQTFGVGRKSTVVLNMDRGIVLG